MKFEVNLHTHCSRCGHASGSVEDYCRRAEQSEIKTLGFSDHGPFPDNRYSDSRMPFVQFKDYVADIRVAQAKHPNLTIFAGVEADYCCDLGNGFYEDTYLGEYGLDYLIAGCHFVEVAGEGFSFWRRYDDRRVLPAFVKRTIQIIECGLFDYLAHPDGFACGISHLKDFKRAFKDIIQAAKACNVPLEINANGFRKGQVDTPDGLRYQYPVELFWEQVAEEGGVSVVIGSDAHTPESLTERIDQCNRLVDRFGLIIDNQIIAKKIADRVCNRKIKGL